MQQLYDKRHSRHVRHFAEGPGDEVEDWGDKIKMAGAGAYGAEIEMARKKAAKAVMEVINSSHFDRENIRKRKLTLSQAYCLLWQDQESGEVRRSSVELNAGCVAAVLLDLASLGRIEFRVEPKSICGINYTNTYVQVGRILVSVGSITRTHTYR